MTKHSKTANVLRSLRPRAQKETPVATDTFLPNYSVVKGASNLFSTGSVLFAGEDGGFQQDNTNFFWDDTNKRLGIGTNSPQTNLELESSSNIQLRLNNTGTTLNLIEGYASRTNEDQGIIRIVGYWSDTLVGRIGIETGPDTTNKDDGQITFLTATGGTLTEAMRINENGNVGIGTDSPTANLHIAEESVGPEVLLMATTAELGTKFVGDANRTLTDKNIFQLTAQWDGTPVGQIRFASGTDTTNKDDGEIVFRTATGGTLSEAMRIDEDGNVGIGTSNPSTKLDVTGTIQQSNAYYHGYDTTGGTTIATSETDIPLDTDVRKDALYTHSTSTNNHEVTIGEAGDYKITGSFTADTTSASARHSARWRAKVDTGGGYATIAGTEAATYHRISADGEDTASITFIHTFAAGDKLKFVGLSDHATEVTLLADGSRVTIERI